MRSFMFHIYIYIIYIYTYAYFFWKLYAMPASTYLIINTIDMKPDFPIKKLSENCNVNIPLERMEILSILKNRRI